MGTSKQTDTLHATEVSHSGSLVGSTDGAVTMTAGNMVAITDSDVLGKTGAAIVGKDVTIAAAENRWARWCRWAAASPASCRRRAWR
ncbi:hypothetical protein XthCFBP4691_03805 [Xanthomonas theicola]|uniref:Uncharacterized protein n=1 Tax=Xanthomonas theicola TaxID=56464 RepID=A0A2S6ZJN7_9XANT|nr:hypothetical protein XthCFBP4691_03805 [Xanthomonas theicola]